MIYELLIRMSTSARVCLRLYASFKELYKNEYEYIVLEYIILPVCTSRIISYNFI
jgi:hypothetical protein